MQQHGNSICNDITSPILTLPLQVVAVAVEVQRIRVVGRLHGVHVKVVQGRLAAVQGQVHVWRSQSAPLDLPH